MSEASKHFRYQNVKIFKSQSLGIGSYGAVYLAKCDQLPCAAKLLHPILADPGAPRNQQRFEQECQFLSGIRHPHIVQYLGTCRDPESGLPVLIMELMDNNLTHFLEESQEPLPYYLEVNLSHDVALALAYLHSNSIIHRDLSSNNVLLIAGSRAKVTDFGMSKLIDATPRMTPLTQCPGTLAYMSPEAVREPPVYTDKLDCFAHGVVTIQIMTRQFPDPGPASCLVHDPRSPTGMTSMPVLEPERRKSHIDRIAPHHPLLSIALHCLIYNEKDRPSAQQLCIQLAALKELPRYGQSMQQAKKIKSQKQGCTANTEDKCNQTTELQTHVTDSDEKIRELQEQVKGKGRQLQQATRQLQEKDAEVANSLQESQKLSDQLRQELRQKSQQIRVVERQLQDKEHIVGELQQDLIQRDKRIRDLEETISTNKKELQTYERPKSKQNQKGSESNITAMNPITLKWRQSTKTPCEMVRGSATVDGCIAYFRPGGSRIIHAFDSAKEEWSELLECPHEGFALAVVKGLLTAIGGWESGKLTNALLSLSREGGKRKWSKQFPGLPTKRSTAAAICRGTSLAVAGGYGDNFTRLSTVELMNTENLQWFIASSLPHPLDEATATICGENLYLLGGFDKGGNPTQSALTCSLSALLQSCQSQSLGTRLKKSLSTGKSKVWHEIADIPVLHSTGATLCEQLLAVGGQDSSGNPTAAVHTYDSVNNSWTIASHMITPHYRALIAVLPGDILMVVGGRTDRSYTTSDTVEIASTL